MAGSLFIVGTPIGNLGDISPRAIKTLEQVDFIAAEDTRVTLKLLSHFNIHKPIVSFFEHNKEKKGEVIIKRIIAGENCALVSDAGMPCISDPGETLAKQCRENNIIVRVVPGPSALTAALAVSGIPSGRFTFEGFLSVSKKRRKEHLEEIKNESRTMIFYEAPHKLLYTLKDLLDALGDRQIAIVREITKIHEECVVLTLSQAIEKFSNGIKGEIVLIISGKSKIAPQSQYTLEQATNIAREIVNQGTSLSEAAKQSAKITNLRKGEIYKSLINQKNSE